jgi:AGZA family xanthine/uracil permease-like MFS transporter
MIASMAIVTVIALITGNATNTHAIAYSDFANWGTIIFKQSFVFPSWVKFLIATFSMLMLMIFEGVGITKGYVKGQKKIKRTLQATGLANIFASLVGSSPSVDAAETGSALAAGAKTGISAITTGIWFLASLVLIPIIGYIPSCATASIIILTGSLMMMDVKGIDNNDFSSWFPAFLIIFTIPFTGSISTGMAMGFIAYPIAKICSGKVKDLNSVNVIIAILFALSLAVTAFAA